MMESIAQLWSQVPGWGLGAVAVAVVWGGARLVRTRKTTTKPTPTLMPPMAPDDPANLDSSHVGGPLFDGTGEPYAGHAGPITKGGAS